MRMYRGAVGSKVGSGQWAVGAAQMKVSFEDEIDIARYPMIMHRLVTRVLRYLSRTVRLAFCPHY